MDLTTFKDWTWLILAIGGVLTTVLAWAIRTGYTVKDNVRQVGEASEANHKTMIRKMEEFDRRVSKVEKENSQTVTMLTDIKVQIAQLATTIELFFKNKK
jgi:hypothetical protein